MESNSICPSVIGLLGVISSEFSMLLHIVGSPSFKAAWYSIVCIHCIFFTYSSVNGQVS